MALHLLAATRGKSVREPMLHFVWNLLNMACKFGYHLKGTKATAKPNDTPKERIEKNDKKKKKKVPDSTENSDTVDEREDDDDCEENQTKTVVKDFLVSVIKLMSGLTKDTKVKVKKKKKDNADLLKTLADLLN